jgi:seryl-tRNA synthetase
VYLFLFIRALILGRAVAGERGFYLKGDAVLMLMGLENLAMQFLAERQYTPLIPPYFMLHSIMGECAQLEQFDEELYKVSGEGEDKYLIATAEQPISCFHRGEGISPATLPLRYAGFSSCFRKEVGSHGRDTLGVFRTHQFDKVEQFVLTHPDKSWEMLEEMISHSEAWNQMVCFDLLLSSSVFDVRFCFFFLSVSLCLSLPLSPFSFFFFFCSSAYPTVLLRSCRGH